MEAYLSFDNIFEGTKFQQKGEANSGLGFKLGSE